jgi:hypothetical protein
MAVMPLLVLSENGKNSRRCLAVKLQIILVALVVSLTGFAAPSIAQRGGRSSSEGGASGYGALGIPSFGNGSAGNNFKGFHSGVLKTVNRDAMVLTKTNAGVDQTFKFSKKTKFIHDGKDSSVESLKLGEQVWVDAQRDKKTGDFNARKVVTGAFLMPSS